jgi:hypothetical protein
LKLLEPDAKLLSPNLLLLPELEAVARSLRFIGSLSAEQYRLVEKSWADSFAGSNFN